MPWIPLAAAAIGLGTQVFGALQGQAAQKDAQVAQQRMDNLKAARERTQQIREANAKAAMIKQGAANSGAAASSSAITGASSVREQAYGNIQYIGYEQQTGEALARARQKELNAQGTADIGKGVTELGGTVANNYDTIFGAPGTNNKDSIVGDVFG